jgi:hypothetical protein
VNSDRLREALLEFKSRISVAETDSIRVDEEINYELKPKERSKQINP